MEILEDFGRVWELLKKHPYCTVVENPKNSSSIMVMRSLDLDDEEFVHMVATYAMDLYEQLYGN